LIDGVSLICISISLYIYIYIYIYRLISLVFLVDKTTLYVFFTKACEYMCIPKLKHTVQEKKKGISDMKHTTNYVGLITPSSILKSGVISNNQPNLVWISCKHLKNVIVIFRKKCILEPYPKNM